MRWTSCWEGSDLYHCYCYCYCYYHEQLLTIIPLPNISFFGWPFIAKPKHK